MQGSRLAVLVALISAVVALPAPAQTGGSGVQIHLVDESAGPGALRKVVRASGETLALERRHLLDERDVASASFGPDGASGHSIEIVLTLAGAGTLAKITAQNLGRRLAIVISGELLVAPVIRTPIASGKVQVSGHFTELEAAALTAAIRSAVARIGPPGPVPPPPATAAGPTDLYVNSWALVIGINAYQKVTPRLNYAVADARAVAAALPALGFSRQNVRVLLDADATKARIETVLYREFARMGPQDRLLVFFAGHGETAPTKTGEEGYILPVDADRDALPITAIAMDEVRRIGNRVRAKHVLFVMDACFSGFALTRDVVPQSTTDEYLAAAMREPELQVLTAGRKGERSIEEGGHGLFTRRLLDGLRGLADPEGRGIVTAAQLAAWIEPRVVRDSKGRMTPQYGKLDGEGQFVFVPGPRPVPRE
jgi:hypothetical protein